MNANPASPSASPEEVRQETSAQDKYGFKKTLWTDLVSPVGALDEEARYEVLSELLAKYRPPLKSFLMTSFVWKYHVNEDWVEDCLQSFVLEKIIIKELIKNADKTRGRFRDLLKESLKNFAIDKYKKEFKYKDFESELSETHIGQTDPAVVFSEDPGLGFDIEWARRVLHQALATMKADCSKRNQNVIWAVFERRRLGTLVDGEQVESLTDTIDYIRQHFGLTLTSQDVSNRQITGDRKFARVVRDVLCEYCRDAEEIETELGHFIELLRKAIQK